MVPQNQAWDRGQDPRSWSQNSGLPSGLLSFLAHFHLALQAACFIFVMKCTSILCIFKTFNSVKSCVTNRVHVLCLVLEILQSEMPIIELGTFHMQNICSTIELWPYFIWSCMIPHQMNIHPGQYWLLWQRSFPGFQDFSGVPLSWTHNLPHANLWKGHGRLEPSTCCLQSKQQRI